MMMMMRMRWLLVGVLPVVFLGQAVALNDPRAAGRLVEDLSSADARVHARAEAELAALPNASREDLRSLVVTVRNAQAKRDMEARLAEMDGFAALNPTLLNVEVKDQTIDQIAGELADKLKINVGVLTTAQSRRVVTLYSLHVHDATFQEVMAKLAEEHVGESLGSNGEVVLSEGGAAVAPAEVVDGVALGATAAPAGRGQLQWTLTAATDPRAVLTGAPTVSFESVHDGRGAQWKIAPQAMKQMVVQGGASQGMPWIASGVISGAGDARMLSLRGKVEVSAVDYDRHEMGEINEKEKAVQVEKYTVRVHERPAVVVEEGGRRGGRAVAEGVNLVLDVEPVERRGAVEERMIAGKPAELRVEFTGARGVKISEVGVPMDGQAHSLEVNLGGAVERPVRAVVKYPVREAAVELPFEFKEVAVPR